MSAPCKDCTERHGICHDHCEKYKAWRKEFEERKEKARWQRNVNYTRVEWCKDYVLARCNKRNNRCRVKKNY